MNLPFIASFVILVAAIVSVFCEVYIVSNYSFWFVIAAYLVLAGSKAK